MSDLSQQVAALEQANERLSQMFKRALDRANASESALAQARVEGAREALTRFHDELHPATLGTGPNVPPRVNGLFYFAKSYVPEFRDREYPATPDAGTPERVVLSDGRVVKWTRWEYRNGVECKHRTLDLVTNLDKPGCESRRCFDSLDEMRQSVALKWADWQAIDAAFAVSLARTSGGADA